MRPTPPSLADVLLRWNKAVYLVLPPRPGRLSHGTGGSKLRVHVARRGPPGPACMVAGRVRASAGVVARADGVLREMLVAGGQGRVGPRAVTARTAVTPVHHTGGADGALRLLQEAHDELTAAAGRGVWARLLTQGPPGDRHTISQGPSAVPSAPAPAPLGYGSRCSRTPGSVAPAAALSVVVLLWIGLQLETPQLQAVLVPPVIVRNQGLEHARGRLVPQR